MLRRWELLIDVRQITAPLLIVGNVFEPDVRLPHKFITMGSLLVKAAICRTCQSLGSSKKLSLKLLDAEFAVAHG